MADWNAEDVLRRLIEDHRTSHSLATGATWTRVRCEPTPRLPDHGWKLHVSSRVDGLPQLAETLFPYLLAEGCSFKVARSDRVLRRLNGAEVGSGAVGKAVTVYPRPERVRDLGLSLAELLRGHHGPVVPSDRRVADDAPVYYRYGPFRTHWRSGPYGTLVAVIDGPDGEEFEAAASLGYRQPPWVSDPFREGGPPHTAAATHTAHRSRPDEGAPRSGADVLLGGRYRAVEGVYESARGNVYRAVDTALGAEDVPREVPARTREEDGQQVDGRESAPRASTVIVKTARAHVSEDRDGNDVRVRLRNERRILTACAGTPGIPVFLDHFAHDTDEYLVTSDVGELNLLEHVGRNGALLPAGSATTPGDDETFARLARELATTLEALHSRGVVMRDVTPRNIVLDGTGRAHLIDFGISALDGLHLPGGTPGYAPREQLDRSQGPSVVDDHYALGMVLVFAATGLPPVTGEASTALARTRALQCLDAVHAGRRPGLFAVVGDLLSREPERSTRALADLVSGAWRTRGTTAHRGAPPPAATADQVADLADRVLDVLLAEAGEYHLGGEASDFPAVDASLYTGSAGIGLELLHHRHRPGVPDLLRRLARHAHHSLAAVPTADGLFSGRTGTEVFLAAARRAGVEVPSEPVLPAVPRSPAPPSAEAPEVLKAVDFDVVSGHAGVGLGRLLLADLGDTGALEAAASLAEPLLAREDLAVLPAHVADDLGKETAFGYAHGYLGITDFLLLLAARTADRELLRTGRRRAGQLAGLVPDLVAAADAPSASQMAVSWCRGLGGLARVLRHAWLIFDEPAFRRAAESATKGCLTWSTRLSTLGQCCGTAGLGSALLDLAVDCGDDQYLDAAHEAARHLLRRSHGPDDAPALVTNNLTKEAPYSWAQGYAGILTFLRRLREPESPDLLPEPTARKAAPHEMAVTG
ncbi:lanthionine synthetase LanC family protein [Streptomyces sp. 891-h]|uniref:class III lanthionine synthetase LanKC N-terminal domain-containing protein n=1 Tax=Streptomyces sp. 891-h TaxID=2720714 RepID=UPI001FAA5499|nr:lanthionine synthetase LanC family protein [Streptomyces sp. 891-h]UNZ20242.1 protein kinase [Streptomyces sp. 891-h]